MRIARWLVSLLSVAGAWTLLPAQAPEVDVLIQGGQVFDGSGSRGRLMDVGIRGERIVFLGNAAKSGVRAARTIDARGLVVTPGFIDTHTHAGGDLTNPERKSNVNFLMQGVTTVIVGNDGGGSPQIAETAARWQQQGIGTNAIQLVGHGAVRRQVLGSGDVQPTPEQLDQMRGLVRSAMREGAYGLSSGLFYTPASYAKTEEVIELAKVAAECGGIYDSHLRDESSYTVGLLAAVDEAIRIGREAKIAVNISHIKALGPDVWGQSREVVSRVRRARSQGVRVTADQYPYNASGSNLVSSLVPAWAQAGGREALVARLNDPAQRPRILQEMGENLRRRAGPKAILFRSRQQTPIRGKTLQQVADERGKPPLETAIELILEASQPGRSLPLSIVSFNMNDRDLEYFMKQDWVMTGSDGSAGHPRMYGTYPRKLRTYVFEKKTISLPFFVRASTSLPAETLRIPERGRLREGYFADVVVFDRNTVADRATFEEPELLAVGMKFVFVNGKLAVENGEYNGALAGKPLLKSAK